MTALLNYLDARDPRLYAFCLLMAATGVRPGEACGLQAGDLNRAEGTLQIERAIDPRAGDAVILPKTNRGRTVDAGPAVFAALDRVLTQRYGAARKAPADAYVLAEADGRPLDVEALRKRTWRPLLVAAGAGRFAQYDLRHFAASKMLQDGESLAYVARQLGHAKQSMTLAHYSHFIPDTRRQRGADRLVAELLATVPQPKQAARARTRPDGADGPELQVVTEPHEAGRSSTRPVSA